MNNALHDVCHKLGVVPRETPPDSKWNRADVVGKAPGNSDASIMRFADNTGGVVCNWTLADADQCVTYFDDSEVKLNPAEKAERNRRAIEEGSKAAKAREAEQSACREWCQTEWTKAVGATPEHPYLSRKGIKAHGARLYKGCLMVPVKSMGGTIRGMQFISEDGTKRFKTGTDKKGCFYPIGTGKSRIVVICEGFATGASIHEATGYDVVVAFDAGNLTEVTTAFNFEEMESRVQRPQKTFIVAGDNDAWVTVRHTDGTVTYRPAEPHENTGIVKGTAASEIMNTPFVYPVFRDVSTRPTDFNDLHKLEGISGLCRGGAVF